ncbi:MAG: DNA primase [Phycisphaerae bacterium]|nr:DNA primase [Phycisphaerae bacterium]
MNLPRSNWNEDVDRVREATDIVRLIGEHISLRSKGREYLGLCPFHDDHTPSMAVVPSKQIYYCFSCGAGGDALSFVKNYHRMEFREALEYLANRAGIALASRRASSVAEGETPTEGERERILSANRTAWDFFRAVCRHEQHGRAARDLLARRGVSEEMVERFGLGAAPALWDGLIRTIDAKGLARGAFVTAGLLKRRESGGEYDAFRDRLIFPIFDQLGRVIAFGGRRLSDAKREDGTEEAKYLNSPESAVFDKGSTLYGLHAAAGAIRTSRVAVVCEGYLDVIACHQAGFTNVVGTLGTALTPRGAGLLRRLCDTVVMLFDGDEAGLRAADRAIEVMFAQPVDVRIVNMSDTGALGLAAKDPDELLKQPGGTEALRSLIAGAADALEFRYARLQHRLTGLGVSARARAIEEDAARLVDLGIATVSPIRRRMVLRRLAQVAGLDETTIVAAVEREGRRRDARPPAAPPSAPDDSAPARAAFLGTPPGPRELVLGCILTEPSMLLELTPEQRDLISAPGYAWPEAEEVARALERTAAAGRVPGHAAVMDALAGAGHEDARRAAARMVMEVEQVTQGRADRLRVCFASYLGEADERQLRREVAAASAGAVRTGEDVAARVARLAATGANPRAMPRAGPG